MLGNVRCGLWSTFGESSESGRKSSENRQRLISMFM